MKITTLFILCAIFSISASTYAQNYKVTINKQNSTIIEVLKEIEKNSEFTFFFNDNRVNVNRPVSVMAKNATIQEVLNKVLNNTGYVYQIIDRQVLIKASANDKTNERAAVAQQSNKRTITGTVKDANGEPIIGANVVQKGTTNGTITDADGNFTITVPLGNATLGISYIGYKGTEIVVGNRSSVDIILKEDTETLEEVVVVGYGIQKKVNLTGAVSSIKGETLSNKNVMSAAQSLQGTAPGLTVSTSNGEPDNATLRVRGIGTLNNNDPLVLIDGVSSSLNAIDPNDIESISVLKDAASASIYGSRAASGVILITSKHAKTDKLLITYKGSVSSVHAMSLPKLVNALEYMQMYNSALANDTRKDDGTLGGHMYSDKLMETWKNSTDRDAYPNSNIIDEAFHGSTQTQHYLGIATGNEKFNTNTSLNYSWEDGILSNVNFKRYGIRSNNEYNVSKILKLGIDLSVRRRFFDNPYNNGDEGLAGLMRLAPIYQTKYSNGVWGGNYGGTPNSLMYIENKDKMTYEDWSEILGKFLITLTPLKGLSIDFSYAPKISDYRIKSVIKDENLYDYKTGEVTYTPKKPNSMYRTQTQTREDDYNILAHYNISLGKHDIAALGGFQYLTNHYEYLYAYRDGNPFPQFEELNAYAVDNQKNNGYTTEWALMSYFGRINYAFANKYLLEANVRYDGSSRFANGYKWGLFPSFSAGWRFTEESFMKNISLLSNGKLRASWGELGNQSGVDTYASSLNVNTSSYAVFGGTAAPGYAVSNYATKDITWETTKVLDFGIDLGFLNNRLNATFDWYKKRTSDILMNKNIPYILGYANSPVQNVGIVDNKGWDLSLSYNDKVGKFNYQITAILSDVHNKIIDMGGDRSISGVSINQEGYPIGSLYGMVADGLFSSWAEAQSATPQWGKLQGGDIRFKDVNNDGKIDNDDRVVFGNTIPRYSYSLDLAAQYKNFDFDAFFQGVGKRDAYVSGYYQYPFQNETTPLKEHLDYWDETTNPNPSASLPRLSINQQTNNLKESTFWKRNGAYLRLKNIQIGYTLPKETLKALMISRCRFFIVGTNVFTLDHLNLSGTDAESPFSAYSSYPITKSWSLGVEVQF